MRKLFELGGIFAGVGRFPPRSATGRRSASEVDAHPSLLGEGVAESLQSGNEAEIVERLRPQLHRQAADVVQCAQTNCR